MMLRKPAAWLFHGDNFLTKSPYFRNIVESQAKTGTTKGLHGIESVPLNSCGALESERCYAMCLLLLHPRFYILSQNLRFSTWTSHVRIQITDEMHVS